MDTTATDGIAGLADGDLGVPVAVDIAGRTGAGQGGGDGNGRLDDAGESQQEAPAPAAPTRAKQFIARTLVGQPAWRQLTPQPRIS